MDARYRAVVGRVLEAAVEEVHRPDDQVDWRFVAALLAALTALLQYERERR